MYVFPLPRKMMKKCSSKVLAMAMVVAMMVPGMNVMAADTISNTADVASAADTQCKTKVTYHVDAGYTWQVPATITFTANSGVSGTPITTGDVEVTKNIIADGKTLKISIADNQNFTIANGNTKRQYTVKKTDADSDLTANGEVLSVVAGTNAGKQNLTFTLSATTDTAEVAGDYEGTLNYVASIQ